MRRSITEEASSKNDYKTTQSENSGTEMIRSQTTRDSSNGILEENKSYEQLSEGVHSKNDTEKPL